VSTKYFFVFIFWTSKVINHYDSYFMEKLNWCVLVYQIWLSLLQALNYGLHYSLMEKTVFYSLRILEVPRQLKISQMLSGKNNLFCK
jgi:hypothetical protein